jgi:DNA modification methylase
VRPSDVRDWGVFRIHVGDCRESMRAMTTGSAQTCVTSPPYFGLRDYGHDGQIGLEATPDAYVAEMVAVFREVRRVLREDGTLWLNLGDSYTRAAETNVPQTKNKPVVFPVHRKKGSSGGAVGRGERPGDRASTDLPPKNLIGIPWRVAFALQQDGWYLRQDIIWHKPNPMPESVRDRCTKAHEYLFLLTKSERYYWDHDAMQEPATGKPPGNKRPTKGGREYAAGATEHRTAAALHEIGARETRNRRSVWTVPTRPFSGAHSATFPPALIEPCVLAGSRPGDIVLDPFGGAGTTAMVAARHGRIGVICELNTEYVDLAERRIATDIFGPAAVAA